MNSGRIIGLILIVVGVGIAVIAGSWLSVQRSEEAISAGGAILGAGLAFIPIALFVGFGIFMVVRGGAEARDQATAQKQRRVLDMVKTHGQASIDDLALEMSIRVDELKEIVYSLVGLQVFDGYINWDAGVLYSEQARALHELENCKNCGGDIDLTGKGVITCRYCGTEYFLSQ